MNLSVKDLLEVSHSSQELAPLSLSQKFTNVSTDSRKIKKGDLFIALRGENFNGHDFISEITKQGARAAIVDAKWHRSLKGKRSKLPLLVVKNTLNAMGELALIYRRKFDLPILVIAGSNGKTTTKELVAHTLGTSFNVLKTEANFNNQVGVPQMLFQLTKKHEIAVLEIGTNHSGEIAWLCNVSEPTHSLITNIGREHLEFFKNLDGVAREELTAFAITEELGGFGFINYDDPYLRAFKQFFDEWSISYGLSTDADVHAQKIGFAKDGTLKVEITVGKKKIIVASHIIADYAPNILAAATAVALHFNVPIHNVKKSLTNYKPHSKRMEIERTKGVTIINDCYNANPESFASALATLDAIPTKGKKYVVAGDMFELGTLSAKEHTNIGKLIGSYRFANSFFIGKDMKRAYTAAKSAKQPAEYYATKQEIANHLRRIIKKGDIILIKGSRGMRMEEIVKEVCSF